MAFAGIISMAPTLQAASSAISQNTTMGPKK